VHRGLALKVLCRLSTSIMACVPSGKTWQVRGRLRGVSRGVARVRAGTSGFS
jgi:hypothetical protein